MPRWKKSSGPLFVRREQVGIRRALDDDVKGSWGALWRALQRLRLEASVAGARKYRLPDVLVLTSSRIKCMEIKLL